MASTKILDGKKVIVSEIEKSIADSESVILFQYQGLTVAELSELRRNLKGTDATVKVYKNTLLKRALDDMNYSFDGFLEGPNAILFGKNLLEPIKVLADFAKAHDKLEIRIGIINGSGNSKLNLCVAILDGMIARVGLAYLLGWALGMGPKGFWLGDAFAGFMPLVIGGVFYLTGFWKKED